MEEITDINQLWRGQLNVELETFEAVTESLRKVEDKLNKLGACDARIHRLQTIASVGPTLAETVVAFLDDPKRFENSKQAGCNVGLTPRQYQSVQPEHQGKISGQGNKLLRNLLVEICWYRCDTSFIERQPIEEENSCYGLGEEVSYKVLGYAQI